MGNCNENLRYMSGTKKWTNRIRKEFYHILKTNLGKMLAKECNIKLYKYITNKGLYLSLLKCKNYIEKCRKTVDNDESNLSFYMMCNSFYIKNEIDRLVNNMEMVNNNVCFLLGKAGSGKTNLLTNFAKKKICNFGEQCIYIDAKDVEYNKIEDTILSYFNFSLFIDDSEKKLKSILLFLKRIFNSKIIVIIEAINENSNIEFYKNICRFINKYYKYKNIKIIISSRTEFYNLKFKSIFDEYLKEDVKYKIISIETSSINKNILENMYNKYKKHFKFNGTVTPAVKEILYDSPILMRIFFECYENSNETICDIDKSKIFSKYIYRLSKQYHNLNKVLKEIVNQMIESNKFDSVYIEQINIDINDIESLICENVLLTKSIIDNVGKVNEEIKETISITYDEIRDYLITNELIKRYNASSIDIKKYIDEMVENKYPIVEGVVKNLYCYFKKEDEEICKYILSKDNLKNYNYGNRDMFFNAHLDFIFSTKQDLAPFEIDYLENLTYIEGNDLLRLIYICAYNTLHSLKPNADLIISKMNDFILEKEKAFNFSIIPVDYYIDVINKLEKYPDTNVEKYKDTLKKVVKYLEKKL